MDTKNIFTDEASRLLEQETKKFGEELKQEAVNEALRSRGEPVEVTASDVRRAKEMFQKREASLRPGTALFLRIYMVLGALMFVGGMIYPYIREYIYKSENQLSFVIAISGLIVLLFSTFLKSYLDMILRYKTRRIVGETKKEIQQKIPPDAG
jgi:hypothetical protein